MRIIRSLFVVSCALLMLLGSCGQESLTTTVIDRFAPDAPSGLLLLSFEGAVVAQWNQNTESDLAGYKLYRSSSPYGPFDQLSTGLLTSASYDDSEIGPGYLYYRVTAVDNSGNESRYSNMASILIPGDGRPKPSWPNE